MAEARVGELAPVGEDKNDKLQIIITGTLQEGEDSQYDISVNLCRDDSEDTEANTRSEQDNPAVSGWKNSEVSSEIASQESTPIKNEKREDKDFTTRDDCHSVKNSQDGKENQENCCTAVVPALAVTEIDERSKRVDPSPELPASLKNAASAAACLVAGSEEDGSVQQEREDECVAVVFPGSVTQDTCCKFVCEILKCVLYLRQQLPMTYDQLLYHQKKQQATSRGAEAGGWGPGRPGGWDVRRCQRTLAELQEVLQQLEVLFSLSRVPRVLLLLGSSALPKEAYEVNMEALGAAPGGRGLRSSACLRLLFQRLFLADFLSDARPVRLLATSVMAMAHRDCGVGWFRPRLDYRVPARPKRRVIALSCDPPAPQALSGAAADDYVWFQAPVTIKGFCK